MYIYYVILPFSRERCVSLDRALDEKQRRTTCGSGGYIPGRSPKRTPTRISSDVPRSVPSTPEIFRYATNDPNSLSLYGFDEFHARTPRQFNISEERQCKI